ncbi:nuclease [Billgrantia azerbaijanica]|nr:nuclease [Halomonas azerbaijanica]
MGNATQSQWGEVALRESRVIRHAKQNSSPLEEYLLKPLVPLGESDITEDVTELYELRRTFVRLDEYLNGKGAKSPPEVRLDWVRALLAPFSELHGLGIGHRDIDLHNLWYATEQRSILVSGFSASFFPERGTVNDLRFHLQGSHLHLPEDALWEDGDIIDPFRIDVFMLAAVAYRICYPESSLKFDENSVPTWSLPKNDPYGGLLDDWFKKGLDWSPEERFSSASQQLADFNSITKREYEGEVDTSELLESLSKGDFIKRGWSTFNIYQRFPPLPGEDPGAGSKLAFKCNFENATALCKLWPQVTVNPSLPGINRRVVNFRSRVEKVKASFLSTPEVLDYGLLEAGGLYIVTRFESGESWLEYTSALNGTHIFKLGLSLIKAVEQCHDQGIAHGDIHPENLLILSNTESEEDSDQVVDSYPEVLLLDLLDFGGSSEPYNLEYGPANPAAADAMARDRYAVYKLVKEIVPESASSDALNEELLRGLSQPGGIPVSLSPLQDALDNVIKSIVEADEYEVEVAAEPLKVFWGGHNFPEQPIDFEADAGIYYFNCKWDRRNPDLILCYITAVNASLTVVINPELRQVHQIRITKSLPLSDLISAASKSSAQLTTPIKVGRGNLDAKASIDLLNLLLGLDPVLTLLEEKYSSGSDGEDEETSDDSTMASIPPRVIWNALLATEGENLLTLEVSKGEVNESQSGRIVVPYQTLDGQPLDFDNDEKVFVTLADDEQSLGELDISETTPDFIAIKPSRSRIQKALKEGVSLQLESLQSKASRDRKQKALERVLEHASVIPRLSQYFDPSTPPELDVKNEPPTSEFLRNRYDDDHKKLNDKQIEAFQRLVKYGPVGVLQGPPGTGKTSFVSQFIHYIFDSLGARNVLLVGQSHTSVDAVAIKAREVCSDKNTDLSVVRMGQERMVATDMLDTHSSALQRQMRHAFHREYDQRIKVFSNRFGLPEVLIDELLTVHRTLAPILTSLKYFKDEISKKHLNGDADNEGPRDLDEQEKSLKDLVRKILLKRYPDTAGELLEQDDLMSGIVSHLCREHNVNNPAAVSKLTNLLDLSHEWLDVLATGDANYDQFLVQTRQLVCGTLVGMGKTRYGISDAEFDWVIVDEAARAQASELMIALQSAKRVLLVGDHRQLPPHYEKPHLRAASREVGRGADKSIFKVTDFERAFYATKGVTLDTQYRMVEPIGKLVSSCFYRDEVGSLITGRGPSPNWFNSLPAPWSSSVVWLDSSKGSAATGEAQLRPGRYVNHHEADQIMNLLKLLSASESVGFLRDSVGGEKGFPIGIITMYRAQKELLEKALSKAEWAVAMRDLIRIDTVDSYQGQENKIVILSLVRDNASQNQGFLLNSSNKRSTCGVQGS